MFLRGNILRARKYRFALFFRVLRNQYVERRAYANVFKFNREKKRFEKVKVNPRCFLWFPTAMFESLRRVPTWGLHTKHYNFQWYPLPNNSSSGYRTSPKLWRVVYLLLFYDISISWLNLLNGKRFYVSHVYETCVIIKLTCMTLKPPIDKVQNLGKGRRNICKDSLRIFRSQQFFLIQLCGEIFITQIFRDLYGDFLLVLVLMGNNMVDGNQQKHLSLRSSTKAWICFSRNKRNILTLFLMRKLFRESKILRNKSPF